MVIPKASQIRQWDSQTIKLQEIESIDLMERAANAASHWILQSLPEKISVIIFCGPGNNGGDGFAIARILSESKRFQVVCVVPKWSGFSHDASVNFSRIQGVDGIQILSIDSTNKLPDPTSQVVAIDALFGTGISRPIEGFAAELIDHINRYDHIVSIDIPSGLHPDEDIPGPKVRATHTISFECPKLNFLHPEYQANVGQLHILPIGLCHFSNLDQTVGNLYITQDMIRSKITTRNKYDHKGNFGHALLVCGSYGKIGAAILCARACLRSGVGLLTVLVPNIGYSILQQAVPEAMVIPDRHNYYISEIPLAKTYSTYGIGCGIGQRPSTCEALREFLQRCDHPVVLDADGINILSKFPELLNLLPEGSILTPHIGELKRLIGEWVSPQNRLDLSTALCQKHGIYIVIKGAHTCIQCPDGQRFFNSTGNPGMATAGSGDVLTGMITSLLAQGYSPADAALIGVYTHGLAGDLAANKIGESALIAQDIIDHIGIAFRHLTTQA